MGRSSSSHHQCSFDPNRQIADSTARNPLSPRRFDHLFLRSRWLCRCFDRKTHEREVEDVDFPAEPLAKLVLSTRFRSNPQLEHMSQFCMFADRERRVVPSADVSESVQRVRSAHCGEVGCREGVERSTVVMGLVTVGILKVLSSVVKSFTSSASLVLTSILSSLLFDVHLKYPR